jgi:hypothetical protein
MIAIEIAALRRLLFFSTAEAALLVSGTSTRAWEHWEAGKRKVPDDVAARMRELCDYRTTIIDAFTARATASESKSIDGSHNVALLYYGRSEDWPADAILWRPAQSALAHLHAEYGDLVRLVAFDAGEYFKWLNRRADSQENRELWALNSVGPL